MSISRPRGWQHGSADTLTAWRLHDISADAVTTNLHFCQVKRQAERTVRLYLARDLTYIQPRRAPSGGSRSEGTCFDPNKISCSEVRRFL